MYCELGIPTHVQQVKASWVKEEDRHFYHVAKTWDRADKADRRDSGTKKFPSRTFMDVTKTSLLQIRNFAKI